MTLWTPALPFQIVYLCSLGYAIFSDIRYLAIANWVPTTLVVAFLPYGLLFSPEIDLPLRLVITAGTFLLSFLFYYLNWFGGGDVKLLTAVSLWIGPAHIATFGMLMAFLGSLLALAILVLRRCMNVRGISPDRFPKVLRRWVEEGVCPYGIAIGIAAVAMAPQIFA